MKKLRDTLFAVGFSLLLPAVAALTLFRSTGEILYYENRLKAAPPALTAGSLLDGSYFSDLELYLTDHAPLRTTLLIWKTRAEMDFLRLPRVNGVVVTNEVLLPYKDYDIWELDYIEALCQWAAEENRALADIVESYGGSYFYLGVPEMFSYFSDKYPSYMNNRQWYLQPTTAKFKKAMASQSVNFIDMGEVFDRLGRPPELYYRSDHHLSYAGALACYHTLMDAFRQKAGFDLPELFEGENLNLIALPNIFLGSYNRELYGLWGSGEKLVYGVPSEEPPFTREDEGRSSEPTVYKLPELAYEFATYEVYMGGDKAETVIRTNRPELPDILIFGDSYTNALESLLYWSFDEMRSLDLRYYKDMTAADYVKLHRPDIVVCIRDDTNYCGQDGNGNPMGSKH